MDTSIPDNKIQLILLLLMAVYGALYLMVYNIFLSEYATLKYGGIGCVAWGHLILALSYTIYDGITSKSKWSIKHAVWVFIATVISGPVCILAVHSTTYVVRRISK